MIMLINRLLICTAVFLVFDVAQTASQAVNRPVGCLSPPDAGPCDMGTIRYFYDQRMNICRIFLFGGCHGNDNRFDGEEQCRRLCKAGDPNGIRQNDTPQNFPTFNDPTTDVCSLPADPGTCTDTNLIQYYYDAPTDSCRLFVYGGCGGNKNRFRTKLTCQVACGGSAPGPLPPVTIPPGPVTIPPGPITFPTPTQPQPQPPITTTIRPSTRDICTYPQQTLTAASFPYRSSFFHIFPQLQIPCDGLAVSWRFIPGQQQVNGAYFAVLRKRDQAGKTFDMVGFTAVRNFPAENPNLWTTYQIPADNQFLVEAGDIMALFFEDWQSDAQYTSIALADKYSIDYEVLKSSRANYAHVQRRGRQEVIDELNRQGFIDDSTSVRAFRYPALKLNVDLNAGLGEVIDYLVDQPTAAPRAIVTPSANAGRSPACEAEFQTSQICLDNALSQGADSRVFKARWFFDITVRMCAMFWYVPDCYQSSNLFNTEMECRQTCFGYMTTQAPVL